MASKPFIVRVAWLTPSSMRLFSVSARQLGTNERVQDTAQEWRKHQTEKPLKPHITNTTSTIANEMPSLGKDSPPPEMISSVDGKFVPTDSVPENMEKMTGGTQSSGPSAGPKEELDVGELEGASFKVEPKRRFGEDLSTIRARLLYQSRKRGTLESDLLLSTFADANLSSMNHDQLLRYDVFLDENDWDIYYWATQEPSPTSAESADGRDGDMANITAKIQQSQTETDAWRQPNPRPGEWAQTVGTFKPAYRPVPSRWKNSEILAMLRKHVKDRSAGGVHEARPSVQGRSLGQHVEGIGGGGLGRMPAVRNFDT